MNVRRGVQHREVRLGSHAQVSDVIERSDATPPTVADQSASRGLMPMSRTATAMQNAIDDVRSGRFGFVLGRDQELLTGEDEVDVLQLVEVTDLG